MSHEDHAELSPSSSGRWLTCHGSVPLSRGHYSDRESSYAAEGTDHHEVGALCLENGYDATQLVGKAMLSGAVLTQENAEHLQKYLDVVRGYMETNHGSLRVEEEVSIQFLTGETGGRGKADAVVFLPSPELIVVDLKFGMGVEVSPNQNSQLMLYAAGVIQKHQLWDEIQVVRLVISQPRILGSAPTKEWEVSIEDLKAFCETVKRECKQIATLVGGAIFLGGVNKNIMREVSPTELVPSADACKFCPAKQAGVCPALAKTVRTALSGTAGFVDESTAPLTLGEQMDMADLVETWLHAIRAKVEAELLAGKPVLGKEGFYKLVRGRKGDRRWTDIPKVEDLMKLWKVSEDKMYKKSLITAAVAEKLLKKSTPELWGLLEHDIVQSEGSLSVAAPTDKRPAVVLDAPLAGLEVEDGSDLI